MYSVHHIALSVINREESVSFYKKLGFDEVLLWEAEDKSLSITHLKNEQIVLELFCYANHISAPESIASTSADLPIIGTKHFGLRVDSIEQAKEDLIAKEIAPADIEIVEGRTGIRYFFVKDPSGILVEVVEDKREFNWIL